MAQEDMRIPSVTKGKIFTAIARPKMWDNCSSIPPAVLALDGQRLEFVEAGSSILYGCREFLDITYKFLWLEHELEDLQLLSPEREEVDTE